MIQPVNLKRFLCHLFNLVKHEILTSNSVFQPLTVAPALVAIRGHGYCSASGHVEMVGSSQMKGTVIYKGTDKGTLCDASLLHMNAI